MLCTPNGGPLNCNATPAETGQPLFRAGIAASGPAAALPLTAPTTAPTPTGAAAASALPKGGASVGKPRFEWYQTPTHLTITFLAKGADDKKSKIRVASQSVEVELVLASGADFVHELRLHDNVQAGIMTTSFGSSKVEVKLSKDTRACYMWPTLEATTTNASSSGAEGSSSQGVAAPTAAPGPRPQPTLAAASTASAPSASAPLPVAPAPGRGGGAPAAKMPSAYASKKDWSAIEKEIEKEEEAEPAEGEAALQKLFRSIYSKGDEETRLAMNKSFVSRGVRVGVLCSAVSYSWCLCRARCIWFPPWS